jgi:NAD(P)-dependent dehydrogenase (short-subunit alcohol dehydrogenase family)
MKNGKALITGATGAIGGAIAIEMAKRGFDLVLHYNTNEKRAVQLAEQTRAVGRKVFAVAADIGSVAEIKRLVESAAESLGGLNLLVHCAATFMKSSFEDVSEESFDDTMNINLKAAFFIAQECVRVMADEGKMIFMSDIAGVKPYAGYLPYCIAKAAVDSLVRGLAKKYAPRIAVNAIAPYVVTRPKGMSDAGWNDLISKTPAKARRMRSRRL